MFTQKFKKFISVSPIAPEPESDQHRVYQRLVEMQRAHTLIDLHDVESDKHYQSIVLNVNEESRQLTIDELFPRGFQSVNNQPLRVSFHQSNGRRISFEGKIISHDQSPTGSYYVLAMPKVLEGEQRRSIYRLNVSNSFDIDTVLTLIDQQETLGRLIDVSAEGARIELSTDDAAGFSVGQNDVALRFNFDSVVVSCAFEIHNILSVSTGRPRVQMGGRFVDMSRDVQRMLERSIMQAQRGRVRI